MATLTVGFGQQYGTIQSAVAASKDGDVLQVQAGVYVNDFAEINTKITLQGMGGMVKMVNLGFIPNEKGILVTNTDVTIDNFEFAGAIVSSQNGAGIRYQGGHLTITNSYFHENQNGILANAAPNGSITIKNSEFAANGWGDGITHNLYVTEVGRLTITDSYFHDAVVGHQIKSRAFETIITNTRVFDNSGNASYSIDLPNGGHAVLTNNIIQQGANSQNSNIISFGVEGNVHTGSTLTMTNNTVINDLAGGNLLAHLDGVITATGTQIWSAPLSTIGGNAGTTVTGTTVLAQRPTLDVSHPWNPASTAALPGGGTYGGAGDDTITGTAGADNIFGGEGRNYLRGGEGGDKIQGGAGFDDINGNQGADTLAGGEGNDWVVGGQSGDILFGEAGNDIVYGNLGDDTCLGGEGNDTIRGGQGDDIVFGGAGDDWLFGDRGEDIVIGGLGADTFFSFGDAGIDRVLDFSVNDGDRVVIEAGTTYTYAQSGVDVVISMSGGAQMILVGVNLSDIGTNWISGG
jgi:Ca2+-binding RTX toxin-like protein